MLKPTKKYPRYEGRKSLLISLSSVHFEMFSDDVCTRTNNSQISESKKGITINVMVVKTNELKIKTHFLLTE